MPTGYQRAYTLPDRVWRPSPDVCKGIYEDFMAGSAASGVYRSETGLVTGGLTANGTRGPVTGANGILRIATSADGEEQDQYLHNAGILTLDATQGILMEWRWQISTAAGGIPAAADDVILVGLATGRDVNIDSITEVAALYLEADADLMISCDDGTNDYDHDTGVNIAVDEWHVSRIIIHALNGGTTHLVEFWDMREADTDPKMVRLNQASGYVAHSMVSTITGQFQPLVEVQKGNNANTHGIDIDYILVGQIGSKV